MKYLSLFSGIGGFELGIIQAYDVLYRHKKQGFGEVVLGESNNSPSKLLEGTPTCIGYSEIDKYATQIYQKHFPNHTNYGDITKINGKELPDFDFLCGGFPCQAFSVAGKRGGFEDTRGTLFFDIARIIREKQPRLLLLENVKGLLSHDQGRTFGTILRTLDELGYDTEWEVLNSKNFGVPQNRERVFIIGHSRNEPRPQVFPLGEDDQAHIQCEGGTKSETKPASAITTREGGRKENNFIVQLNNPTHSNDRVYGTDGVSPTLNTMQGGRRQPFVKVPEATKKGYTEATVGQSINLAVPNSKTRRGRVSDVAQTLDTGMQQHTLTSDAQIRRLTPTECERLQGFPDGWTEGLSDTQRYKTLGNAVTVNVIQAIVEKMFKNDIII